MESINFENYMSTPSGRQVHNQLPTRDAAYKIAVIGEAPGKNEEIEGKPFVGASGQLLNNLLAEAGMERDCIFVGNVCQYRPPDNQMWRFGWYDTEIQSGIAALKNDMIQFRPNLVMLMGVSALRLAKGTRTNYKGKESNYSMKDWRGSVFVCQEQTSPFFGIKCMATYHPANIFRQFSNLTYVRFDFKKARRHAMTPDLPAETWVMDVDPHAPTIIARLRAIRKHKIPIGLDLEGHSTHAKIITYANKKRVTCGMLCISISPTPQEAFIIPFADQDYNSFWTLEEEVEILYELALTMEDPNVPKVMQNGMYDAFVKAYGYKILIRGVRDDTLIKNWEIYCELAKDLGALTSIYTDKCYYKDEIHATSQKGFWTYCCKDSAVTNEINHVQDKVLVGSMLQHYRFNMQLFYPYLYIELKGMLLDTNKRDQRIRQLEGLAWFNSKKKTSGGTEQLKLEEMVGFQLNTNSNPQMVDWLYNKLKLPPQYKKRADGSETLTADYETLLTFGIKLKDPRLLQCIKVRQLRKRCSDLASMTVDPDGRIRSSIGITGTDTGRTTSSEAPTGEGTNLQTVRDDDRDLFLADPGNDFGQMDLEGADGWTVAAHCARLGDFNMLHDYLGGLKPAKIVALMYLYGEQINDKSREELKQLSKNINADTDKTNNYLYYGCKRVQHGTNYRMGPAKVVEQIFMDTEGAAILSVDLAAKLQHLYKLRYKGVNLWQDWIKSQLLSKGYLICASGHRRLFFGRKDDEETFGQACAEEPQHNTTWITNLALLKLWTDPENYNPNGSLIIWPCHQIHDALCLQWPTPKREWARKKIHYYFDNPVTIAGQRITIPFAGRIGTHWPNPDSEPIEV